MTAQADYTQAWWPQFVADFLHDVGAPVTKADRQALEAMARAEGTTARYNPIATSRGTDAQGKPLKGITPFNDLSGGGHVYNYVSVQQGARATADTLLHANPAYGYGPILHDLRSGRNARATVDAFTHSSGWPGDQGRAQSILAGLQGKPLPAVPPPSAHGSSGGGSGGSGGGGGGGGIDWNPLHHLPGYSAVHSVDTAITKAFTVSFWIRVGFVIVGFVLLIVGVSKLLGSGVSLPALSTQEQDEQETKADTDEAKAETRTDHEEDSPVHHVAASVKGKSTETAEAGAAA